jgi:hypothetical protein
LKCKLFLLTLLTCLFTISAAAQQDSQRVCSNRLGKGTYGYSCSGALGGQPFAAYGVVAADGRGQYNGHGKFSVNGEVHAWTHNTRRLEPSTVNPDCTGNVTYQVTVDVYNAPDAHFKFVIVDGGHEIKGFPIDPGYAVSCQLILENEKE